MRVSLLCIVGALAEEARVTSETKDVASDVAGRQLRSSFLQAGDVAGDLDGDDIDLSRIGTGHETEQEKRMEEIGSKVNLDDLENRVKAMNAEAVKALQETSAAASPSSLLQTEEADQEAEKGKQVKAGDTDARAQTWLNEMESIGKSEATGKAKSRADKSSTESETKMDAQMRTWMAEFERIKDEGLKDLDALRPRPKVSFDELEKKIHALEVLTGVDTKKAQQSLLETEAADAPKPSFASVSAKIAALEKKLSNADKTQTKTEKTSDAKAAPSSLIQLGEQQRVEFDPSSSLMQLTAQVKSKEFAKSLLAAAENSDEVKRFNAATDAKFEALKQRLHKISENALKEPANMVPMSFAQTGKGRIPTWAETTKMLQEERSSLQAFSRRNEDQIEALKEHKPIMSVLQMGMDASPMVPSSFLEAPADGKDAGEKTKQAVDEYMKDFNEGIEEGALQAKKMPAFSDPVPSSLVEDPAADAANAGMRDLYQIDASMRKMQADQAKLADDTRRFNSDKKL